jgi:hypothetical protein
VCTELKGFKNLKCLKVATRSARKSLFQGSELQGRSGRIRPLNLLKDNAEKLCLEELSRSRKFTLQVDEFCGRTLSHFADSSKEERTDTKFSKEIL